METNTEAQIAALRYRYAVLERRLARHLLHPKPDDAEVKKIKTAQLYLREKLDALRRKRREVRADALR